MAENLHSIFNAGNDLSAVRVLLAAPQVFDGPFSRIGGRAPAIWKDVSSTGAVYRWDTSQGPSIHILPYYLAKRLLEGSQTPLEVPHFYHDKAGLRRMKRGEIALGIARKSGIVAVMIKAETTFLLLDFQENRNRQLEAALRTISQLDSGAEFMVRVSERGISVRPLKQTEEDIVRPDMPSL